MVFEPPTSRYRLSYEVAREQTVCDKVIREWRGEWKLPLPPFTLCSLSSTRFVPCLFYFLILCLERKFDSQKGGDRKPVSRIVRARIPFLFPFRNHLPSRLQLEERVLRNYYHLNTICKLSWEYYNRTQFANWRKNYLAQLSESMINFPVNSSLRCISDV